MWLGSSHDWVHELFAEWYGTLEAGACFPSPNLTGRFRIHDHCTFVLWQTGRHSIAQQSQTRRCRPIYKTTSMDGLADQSAQLVGPSLRAGSSLRISTQTRWFDVTSFHVNVAWYLSYGSLWIGLALVIIHLVFVIMHRDTTCTRRPGSHVNAFLRQSPPLHKVMFETRVTGQTPMAKNLRRRVSSPPTSIHAGCARISRLLCWG